ncbi:hypothetical protein JCM3770_000093 [Rhodotorula araucariae]
MSGWEQRVVELDQALTDLPAEVAAAASSRDHRLHLALLRAEHAAQHKQDLPTPLKRLRTAALTPADFPLLSTLSSTGSFSKVELVQPASSLEGDGESVAAHVLVMKTIERRWGFRMRAHQHTRHELAVLRLFLADDSEGRTPRLIASFLSPASFHLVLSFSTGGDLWTILEQYNQGVVRGEEKGLPEEWVKGWMAELVDAVEWLHGRAWAHRDIKPQNLLLDAAGHLQLTDFGSSAPLTPDTTSIARKNCRVLLGTPDYIAPEVLKHAERVFSEEEEDEEAAERSAFGAGEEKTERDQDERAYGAEVDWWACGVVMYELLFGCTPFFAEEISETYERIVNWQRHFRFPSDTAGSASARSMISRLLVSADARSSPKSHDWFAATQWDHLRSSPPAYVPPPFSAPAASSDSFTRSHRSLAQSSFDYSSFFSSPGLSILRPSTRAANAVQTEEQDYWAANEWGGLTTLPAADAFLPSSSAIPSAAAPAPPATAAASPAARPPPSNAFSTPLRPLSRLAQLRSGASASAPHTGGVETPRSGSGTSSARSRRVVSGMDAWREMQEHAWSIGRSAAKGAQPLPGAASFPTGARERDATGLPAGRITGLQRRQEEVVQQLDHIDEKYRGLFALAAREGMAGSAGA